MASEFSELHEFLILVGRYYYLEDFPIVKMNSGTRLLSLCSTNYQILSMR
jgi:hypothetical protein